MRKDLLRKEFPVIRPIWVKGEKFFQVDARKKGTDGKRESFGTEQEARDRANEIAKDHAKHGHEGLAMPSELRAMAFAAERMLQPYGKTILQGAEFLRDFLEREKTKHASALVPVLAKAWVADKESGVKRKLREPTLKDLRSTRDTLSTVFETKRILDVADADIEDFLGKQDVGLQRKKNLLNLFGQFFNWCIKKKHLSENPCDEIEVIVEAKAVVIFKPDQAENLLRICERPFPGFILYHAICLFAGLRPEECQFLSWEQIRLDEREITVLAEISKTKEERTVPIEDTLFEWIEAYAPAMKQRKGYVTNQTNFKNYTLQIHIAVGFKGKLTRTKDKVKTTTEHNPNAPTWIPDIMRHSYASYWLAKNRNKAALAENMGDSVKIIKKHYKRTAPKSDTLRYWAILPTGATEAKGKELADISAKF